jgi:DNA processing protein
VESADDILEEYGLTAASDQPREKTAALAGDEGRVYAALSFDSALGVEELVMKVQLPAPVVTYILLQLALKGLVAEYGGQRFARIPGRGFVE